MISLAAEGGFPNSVLSDDLLRDDVDLLVRLVEAAGAVVIFIGAAIAAMGFVDAGFPPGRHSGVRARPAQPGSLPDLGLEFQLASDDA